MYTKSHDVNGTEWARLTDIQAGDTIKFDNGFDCIPTGAELRIEESGHGLFVPCSHGQHYLAGQADNGDHPSPCPCGGLMAPWSFLKHPKRLAVLAMSSIVRDRSLEWIESRISAAMAEKRKESQ